jgi:hypothetical protein
MSRRIRSRYELNWPLPWQIEVAFAVIGVICIPFGMYWFTMEITSPATMLGQVVNMPVDVQPIVTAFKPMIWIFGLIIGWRVRCWLRRVAIHQLNRIL